jgi:hypothetical protein
MNILERWIYFGRRGGREVGELEKRGELRNGELLLELEVE